MFTFSENAEVVICGNLCSQCLTVGHTFVERLCVCKCMHVENSLGNLHVCALQSAPSMCAGMVVGLKRQFLNQIVFPFEVILKHLGQLLHIQNPSAILYIVCWWSFSMCFSIRIRAVHWPLDLTQIEFVNSD